MSTEAMMNLLKFKVREALIGHYSNGAVVHIGMIRKDIDRLLEGAKVVYHAPHVRPSFIQGDEDTHASLVLFNEPLAEEVKTSNERQVTRTHVMRVLLRTLSDVSNRDMQEIADQILSVAEDEPAEPEDKRSNHRGVGIASIEYYPGDDKRVTVENSYDVTTVGRCSLEVYLNSTVRNGSVIENITHFPGGDEPRFIVVSRKVKS